MNELHEVVWKIEEHIEKLEEMRDSVLSIIDKQKGVSEQTDMFESLPGVANQELKEAFLTGEVSLKDIASNGTRKSREVILQESVTAYNLMHNDGLSIREIAEKTGVSFETVRRRIKLHEAIYPV